MFSGEEPPIPPEVMRSIAACRTFEELDGLEPRLEARFAASPVYPAPWYRMRRAYRDLATKGACRVLANEECDRTSDDVDPGGRR